MPRDLKICHIINPLVMEASKLTELDEETNSVDAGRLLKGINRNKNKTNPRIHHLRVPEITTKRENNLFFFINNSEIFIRIELQIVHKACTIKQE